MEKPFLGHTFDRKTDLFKDGILSYSKSHILGFGQDYGWSPRKEKLIVFTVFGRADYNNIRFIGVSQQFGLVNIFNNEDSLLVLEQCAYIAFDSMLKELSERVPKFKETYSFAPLNEAKTKSDLRFMLANIP